MMLVSKSFDRFLVDVLMIAMVEPDLVKTPHAPTLRLANVFCTADNKRPALPKTVRPLMPAPRASFG
jgi:hypothetical protein